MKKIIPILFLAALSAQASEDPISWEIVSAPMPPESSVYNIYQITYELTSNLPFTTPTPLIVEAVHSSEEFTVADACSNQTLDPNETCLVVVSLAPQTHGHKHSQLTLHYSGNAMPLPKIETHTLSAAHSFTGLIGVDYNPNHYPNGIVFNNHDVFYVGMNAANHPITNVYAELSQLQQAGFNTARSYQTVEYSWIGLINEANRLGMNIVYEAVIPQNGSQSDIDAAVDVLNNVITAVTSSVFQDTVSLVFAGHENYNNSNVTYLTDAVIALQAALTQNSITTPVGSALLSEDLVSQTPSIIADMGTLINSYSSTAPIGFDPYPFQWGVPVAQAVSTTPPPQATESIAWNYETTMAQTFYVSPRTILMAESGWATQGDTSQYACNAPGLCAPSEANAATYLSALYAYVRDTSNLSGLLVFEAYDEPYKDPNPDNAENFYGVFDSNCNLKNNDTNLLPNTAYDASSNYGCQGFIQGALLVMSGTLTNQPPFTVALTQQNPVTAQSANMTVTVPTQTRDTNINPWPNFLAFNNAALTLTGSASGTVCTGTVPVSGNPPTVNFANGPLNCTNSSGPVQTVNCNGNVCFLPGNF